MKNLSALAVVIYALLLMVTFYSYFLSPPVVGYWGNMRGLFHEEKVFGAADSQPYHKGAKLAARFTSPQNVWVKGVYTDACKTPEIGLKVKLGLQSGVGHPDGVWLGPSNLGYFEGFINELRPVYLLQERVPLTKNEVYFIVLEVLNYSILQTVGLQAFHSHQQYQSRFWSHDNQLDYVFYGGEGDEHQNEWYMPRSDYTDEKMIPTMCVITEEEQRAFPVASIDFLYTSETTKYVYSMRDFPRTMKVDQLVLKLARYNDNLDSVTVQLKTDTTLLATETFSLTTLPKTTKLIEMYGYEPHYFTFERPLTLEKGENYHIDLTCTGMSLRVGFIASIWPLGSGQGQDWFTLRTDIGSFYDNDFVCTQYRHYVYSEGTPGDDLVFAFRVREFLD